MQQIARKLCGAVLTLAVALTIAAGAQAQTDTDKVALAGHLAVYDLKLAQSRGKQSVESVRGRILYDFGGSVCEGYTLNFRQVTELDSGEGKQAISDLRSSNWEEGTGKSFRFTTLNFLNGQEVNNTEGKAERSGDSIAIALTKPKPRQFKADNVVFPSDHMRRIILAGRAGRPLLETGTYDGAEDGEKIYNSLTVIGQVIAPGERPSTDAASGNETLRTLRRWPVTISYFDRAKQGSDQTPAYSISFELYDNGIARGIKIDYGDFVLDGEMTSLELRNAKPCP